MSEQMNDAADLLDKLAASLVDQLQRSLAEEFERQRQRTPAVPLSIDLWNFEIIGQYLKRDAQSVRNRVVCQPDFPTPIRLPSDAGNRAHPLWKATEVIKWAESHRNNTLGRPRKHG